ncbi:MAG TPA: thymidine phosphorylase [bacterium]|nr:thymidine phosphorylase [bacterium]
MRSYEVIRTKRDGGALPDDAVREFVGGFVRGDVSDAEMAAFLMAVYYKGLSETETSALTQAMVASGETLDLSGVEGPTVDKHSTGGVGDKTSLVVVPLVAAAGARVAKLSGRALGHTGGTLDKLEAIPGLRVELEPRALVAQVNRVGCAIAGQSAKLVPADKRLYALRDRTATVESVPLIASSVMSKKIAAGSGAIVLDVKTGSGAFMKTPAASRALAETMVKIGRAAGRRTAAVLSSMEQPLGRTVGNAVEVVEAIRTLRGAGPDDLTELALTVGAQMLVLAGVAGAAGEARKRLEAALAHGDGARTFAAMIDAQGGDPRVVDEPDRLPLAEMEQPVAAPADGFVTHIDAEAVGYAAIALGAGRAAARDRIDPGAGIILERKVGHPVRRGDALARLRGSDAGRMREAGRRILGAYRIGAETPGALSLVLDVIA